MKKSMIALFWILLASCAFAAEPLKHLPMPPKFTADAGSEKILATYPLGVITRMAAFAHHGKADRTVTLINGMEGWVYVVHTVGESKTYKSPGGADTRVNETAHHPAMATYTLVFDHGGTVVDVLYAPTGSGAEQSALLVQRQQQGDQERPAAVPGKDP